MPIDPRLVFINSDNPPRWALYALCVLNRAASYGAIEQCRQWAAWAGGGSVALVESTGPIVSNAVVIQDGEKAIISLCGTRSLLQLSGQIVGSSMVMDTPGEGRCGAFWAEYANRISPFLDQAIGGLPGDKPALVHGHSLGGAIATILAARYRFTGNRNVAALVTTGQPRAGGESLNANLPASYTRIVNQGDPVPGIPPATNAATAIGTLATLGFVNFLYEHGGRQWLLTNTSFGPGNDPSVPNTLGTFLDATMQGDGFAAGVNQYHDVNVYAQRLYQFIEGNQAWEPRSINALDNINGQIDLIAAGQQVLPPPQANPPIPPQQVFADPNVIVWPIPARLPLPDLDQLIQFIQFNLPRLNTPNANPILLFSENGMTALVKTTFFFTQRNQGWSETYYRAGSLTDTVQKAYDLGNALIALRGINTGISGFRIAQVNVPTTYPRPRVAQLFAPLPTWATGSAVINGDKDSDAADTCLLMRCYDTTGNAAAKFIFMRGVSDNFIIAGGIPIPGGMSAFGGSWITLQQKLGSDGWGWVGNAAASTVMQISALAYTAPNSGYVAFTFTGNLFPNSIPLGQNITVPIRVSRVVTPGNINGQIPVVVNAALNACVTKKRIAILPWDGNSGQASFNGKQFWQFKPYVAPGGLGNTGILLERIGERKAGRPFGTPPGRARNRVRA